MAENEKKNGETRLTIKQLAFVKEYLNNGGNGTQAALKTYNTNDPVVAARIGSGNVRNRHIAKLIKQGLTAKGLTVKQIIGNIEKIASVEAKPSAKVVLNANLALLKVHGAFPNDKKGGNTTNIQFNVENLNYGDLKKQLKSIDDGIQHLMGT